MIITERQKAVLDFVVEDGQAWADNAKEEAHILAKVARWEAKYDAEVAKGGYKNRKQSDEAQAKEDKDRYDNASYSVKRKRSYPPIGDQLDALWKGGDDADAMKAIVNKVKSDNPKG